MKKRKLWALVGAIGGAVVDVVPEAAGHVLVGVATGAGGAALDAIKDGEVNTTAIVVKAAIGGLGGYLLRRKVENEKAAED
jgi:hypothetical protein